MSLFKKLKNKRKNNNTPTKFKKMMLYIIVTSYGYSGPVLRTLCENGSNAQFITLGKGTAKTEVLHVFGLENRDKDVILAFVDEENVLEIKQDLEKLFSTNKKIMGFGFTIQLTSIVGEKLYHFLTNTL